MNMNLASMKVWKHNTPTVTPMTAKLAVVVGDGEGISVGDGVGDGEGISVGNGVGDGEGISVGDDVGDGAANDSAAFNLPLHQS